MSKAIKIKIDKYAVFKRLDSMQMLRSELAKELEVTEGAVLARYAQGWRVSDALNLARILDCKVPEITEK